MFGKDTQGNKLTVRLLQNTVSALIHRENPTTCNSVSTFYFVFI
jgi:hypothetical protein